MSGIILKPGTETDVLPFTAIEGIDLGARGKLARQDFEIKGLAVSFQLASILKVPAQAVVVPHFRNRVSEHGVMGVFERSEYRHDTLEFKRRMTDQMRSGPYEYGKVVYTPIQHARGLENNLGKPSYFFNAITVTGLDEPQLQFNAIREAVKASGWAAQHINENEEGVEVRQIVLPALGTSPGGHLKGFQSARAIFAGIYDLGQSLGSEVKQRLSFSIALLDDPIHAPIIDEFLAVKKDASYKHVPPEGEVGLKAINLNMVADYVASEEKRNEAYRALVAYRNTYLSYDS